MTGVQTCALPICFPVTIPFVQGSAAMAGSRAPASGGSAAIASPSPSLQAFRPDFSDVGSALASMAQARASMINAEQNAVLTPYRINQILGDTNYRNIGVGQSGYWNASTGSGFWSALSCAGCSPTRFLLLF